MGGIVSNPLDDAKRQEIQDTVEEVMGVFSKEFAMGYKTALIDKIRAEKEEKHAKGGYEYQLVDPPKDATVIKAGYITKRGDVKKNWLKRYFVALNEADNYDILYFDKQVDDAKFAVGDDLTRSRASMAEPGKVKKIGAAKLKGTMKLCNYTVSSLDGEKLGLKMEGNDEQRPWLVKFDNEGELAEWKSVFETAAKQAQGSLSRDSVIKGGFLNAYQATRYSQGLWGYWHEFGTEEDMLGALLNEVLHRRILRDVYASIPDNPMKSMVEATVKKVVSSIVRAGAGSAWKAAETAMSSVSKTLEDAAGKALGPILELEPKMIAKVQDLIGAKIEGPIQSAVGEKAAKVFEVVLGPLGSIYAGAVAGFKAHVPETALKELAGGKGEHEAYLAARWGMWSHSSGIMSAGGVWKTVDTISASEGLNALGAILAGQTASSIAFDASYDAAALLEKALFDFKMSCATGDGQAAYTATLAKLVNDAKIHAEVFSLKLLGSIIAVPISEIVNPMIEEGLEPVQELVPDALSDLINIPRVAITVIDGVRDDALRALVTPALVNELAKIEAAA